MGISSSQLHPFEKSLTEAIPNDKSAPELGHCAAMTFDSAVKHAFNNSPPLHRSCSRMAFDEYIDATVLFVNSHPENGPLTFDQRAAINFFVCAIPFSRTIRAACQQQDSQHLEPFLPFLKLLDAAITTLSRHDRTLLYRATSTECRENVGHTFTCSLPAPCTDSVEEITKLVGTKGSRTWYSIDASDAANITNYVDAGRVRGGCWLLPFGAELEVISKAPMEVQAMHCQLSEVRVGGRSLTASAAPP